MYYLVTLKNKATEKDLKNALFEGGLDHVNVDHDDKRRILIKEYDMGAVEIALDNSGIKFTAEL